jgi:RHS repeat-associated protein
MPTNFFSLAKLGSIFDMSINYIFFSRILLPFCLILCTANTYSQNINSPNIHGPEGLSVNSYSARLFYKRSDLNIPGRGLDIDLTFYYNLGANAYDYGYGNGWTMSYNIFYERESSTRIAIWHNTGREEKYNFSAGKWNPPTGVFDSLYEYQPGKFQLRNKNGTVHFFDDSSHKRLTKIADANYNILSISYMGNLPTTITDPSGRSITLSYTNSHLTTITDLNVFPPRQSFYTYDSTFNMTSAVDFIGNTIHYQYDALRRMTMLTDKSNYQYTIVYIGIGHDTRVSQIISPVSVMNFFINNSDNTCLVTEVVNNAVTTTTYKYQGYLFNNLTEKTGSCCGFHESYEYDSEKNLKKKIDANSNTWLYLYDSKGNRTRETDPVGGVTEYAYEPLYSKVTEVTDKKGNSTSYSYDAQGNLISILQPIGISESYTYDPYGNVATHTDKRGLTTNYTYNSYGYKTLESFPDGSTNSYTYDNAGRKTSFMDGNGNVTSYFYDALNRLIQTQDAVGNSEYRTYDAKDNLTSVTDKLGRVTSYVYDALNRKTKIISPAGTTAMTYDEKGNILTKRDGNGNVTVYTYDSRDLLISEKNALGHIKSIAYDNKGNKITETDFSGNPTSYTYDDLDRIIRMTDALSHNMFYGYDANGNRTSFTDANGNTTTYEYDELDRLVKTKHPIGTESITYDGNGNIVSRTDANGNTTYFNYDDMNRQTGVTDANAHTTLMEYDDQGNLIRTTDRNGHKTSYGYDALNRRINETNPLGEITSSNYNAVGNVTSSSMPNGNIITYTHDVANRLVFSSDNEGLIETISYDANSNIVIKTDGNGNTIINKYDALNRLTRVRDAMGRHTSYAYNNSNSLLSFQDRNGRTTTYTYDVLQRRLSTNTPAGNNTAMAYDNNGNLLSITDDNGNATTYIYDANNRLLTETYANGKTRTFTYDDNGNIKSRKDNNNKNTDYKYDNLNRLIGREYGGTEAEYFTYDNENRMINAVNNFAGIEFTYDEANRMTSETRNGKTTNYNYDIPGRSRTLKYPGDRVVSEEYDFRMRLENINSGISVNYTLDAGNRILTRNFSNGVNTDYSYNANNWITSLNHVNGMTTIAGFNYTFDNEGNRLTAQKMHSVTNSEKYSYDFDERLTNYKEGTLVGNDIPSPVTQTQFNYDAIGNRKKVIKDGDSTGYIYNNVNAYTSITDTGTVLPTHDANGNTTYDGRHYYSFDFENRLVSVDGGATANYKYDALGRRIQKVTSAGTVNYYYDEQRIIEERDGSDDIAATYVYGTWIDDVLSMNRGGTDYFYHQNSLGSVAALTTSTGVVAERYEYDAYGNPSVSFIRSAGEKEKSGTGNTFMFTGREYDAETQTYHYRARFYKPDWGRFGQWDPLGLITGMNMYEYLNSNSTKYIDPFGLKICCLEKQSEDACYEKCVEEELTNFIMDVLSDLLGASGAAGLLGLPTAEISIETMALYVTIGDISGALAVLATAEFWLGAAALAVTSYYSYILSIKAGCYFGCKDYQPCISWGECCP